MRKGYSEVWHNWHSFVGRKRFEEDEKIKKYLEKKGLTLRNQRKTFSLKEEEEERKENESGRKK